MCATFNVDNDTLGKYLDKLSEKPILRESGDVFPSDKAVILTANKPILCKWGFLRYDKKGVTVNARAETVTQKSFFFSAFYENRCVIPAVGFYEWDGRKNKYYFVRSDGAPMFLCGFYKHGADGSRFVVLTKNSTPPVNTYHDRIPVIADETEADDYIRNSGFAVRFIAADTRIKLSLGAPHIQRN